MTIDELIIGMVADWLELPITVLEHHARRKLGISDVFVVRAAFWRLIDQGVLDFTTMRDLCAGGRFYTRWDLKSKRVIAGRVQ